MNRPVTPGLAAALALPLLAATLALPAGLDATPSPLAASGAPLLWAALFIIGARLNPVAASAALVAVLPFSAYALAAYGPRPSLPWLVTMIAGAAAAVTLMAAGNGRTRGTAENASTGTRLRAALLMLLGAAPGLAIAQAATPWSGAAVSTLVAAVALLVLERRSR